MLRTNGRALSEVVASRTQLPLVNMYRGWPVVVVAVATFGLPGITRQAHWDTGTGENWPWPGIQGAWLLTQAKLGPSQCHRQAINISTYRSVWRGKKTTEEMSFWGLNIYFFSFIRCQQISSALSLLSGTSMAGPQWISRGNSWRRKKQSWVGYVMMNKCMTNPTFLTMITMFFSISPPSISIWKIPDKCSGWWGRPSGRKEPGYLGCAQKLNTVHLEVFEMIIIIMMIQVDQISLLYTPKGKVQNKHRHRRNVTSHHSFSLLWQF